MSTIVQYILLRGDLSKQLNWPMGGVIAQACHAATSVVHLFYEDQDTQEYLKRMDSMHKVVLEVPDEPTLNIIRDTLVNDNIKHKLWIEQPENIPTCLAVKPYPKDVVQKYFKGFKLYK